MAVLVGGTAVLVGAGNVNVKVATAPDVPPTASTSADVPPVGGITRPFTWYGVSVEPRGGTFEMLCPSVTHPVPCIPVLYSM